MNKRYKFITNKDSVVKHSDKSENSFCHEFEKGFSLDFHGNKYPLEQIPEEARIGGRIVKSEIEEGLRNQLKAICDDVVSTNNEILYFKMSAITQNKLRIFYSYEVSNLPKQNVLTDQDKKMGKIVGYLNGIKIILDEDLKNNVIVPLVKSSHLYKTKNFFISKH